MIICGNAIDTDITSSALLFSINSVLSCPLMINECLNFLLNLSHGVRSFVMFIKIYGESNQLQLQSFVGYD